MLTPAQKEKRITQIDAAARKLFLSSIWGEYCRDQATPKQMEFLLDLVSFPPSFTREDLETCQFIAQKQNLVLFGPVGVGKTHLAIAAGVKACKMGLKTRFYTVTGLVLKLAEARKSGTLERLIRELQGLDLLILYEWGYVPIDKEGSQLLFRVISDSYENKSLILTTNIEFSKWGSLFTNIQMAEAMIDRLVHHGHLLIFEGPSYRMEHALMRQDGRASSQTQTIPPKTGNAEGEIRENCLTKNTYG